MNKKNMIEYDLIKNIMSDDFINFLKQYSEPLEKINNTWYLPIFYINQFEINKFEINKKDLTL
mgnify:FL=1